MANREPDHKTDAPCNPERRKLGQMVFGGALGAAALLSVEPGAASGMRLLLLDPCF